MAIGGLIIVFTCLWWLIFYMVLPIGTKVPKIQEKGHAGSAPSKHYLIIKAVITTILTIILTITYYELVKHGILSANMLKPTDMPY